MGGMCVLLQTKLTVWQPVVRFWRQKKDSIKPTIKTIGPTWKKVAFFIFQYRKYSRNSKRKVLLIVQQLQHQKVPYHVVIKGISFIIQTAL
jgi:hypothetical protein